MQQPDIRSTCRRWRSAWTALVERCFYRVGVTVGRRPWITILLACIAAGVLSLGLCRAQLYDSIRSGYTPTDAPSHRELAALQQFFGAEGEAYQCVVMVAAADGGSMMRNETLAAVVRLNEFLVEEHTVSVDGHTYGYQNVCRPYCQWNDRVEKFTVALQNQMKRLESNETLNPQVNINYPRMTVWQQKVPLGDMFHGIVRHNESIIERQLVPARIKSIATVTLTFRAIKSSPLVAKVLDAWELSLPEQMARWRAGISPIRPLPFGEQIISREVRRVGYTVLPLFAVSFVVMLTFALVTVCVAARLRGQLDVGKPVIAVIAVVSPVLAIGVSVGGYSALFSKMGSIVMVVPFLILAIGVDDAFLMIHSWQSMVSGRRPHLPADVVVAADEPMAHRLGLVLVDIGPSMLITSVTNAMAFGVGTASPTPEIRLFCMMAAFGMLADFFFQTTLFAACLLLTNSSFSAKLETKQNGHCNGAVKRQQKDSILVRLNRFIDCYAAVITTWWTALLVAVVMALYLSVAISGVSAIQAFLEPQQLLLADSPVAEAEGLRVKYEWKQFCLTTILVNNARGLTSDARAVARVHQLLGDFERLPQSVGVNSTSVWIRPYNEYLDQWYQRAPLAEIRANLGLDELLDRREPVISTNSSNEGGNVYDDYYEEEQATSAEDYDEDYDVSYPNKTFLLNLERWTEFIGDHIYNPWNATVVWSSTENGSLVMERFAFETAYKNLDSWLTRTKLLLKWREIAERYTDLNVTIFEKDSYFMDQIPGLKQRTLNSVLITFICMAVICVVFIPDLNSVVWASVAIASITIGVVGFSHYWNMHLDPITLAAILMSIGFSVDYTAHICYHFNSSATLHRSPSSSPSSSMSPEALRLAHALRSIGWPMLQAAGSTLLSVLPLLLVSSYMSAVFAKIVTLITFFGLVHGLVVAPVCLTAVPRVGRWLRSQLRRNSGSVEQNGCSNMTNNQSPPVQVTTDVG